MAQPLMIRFATDTAAAKQGIANLAGSVASNMVTIGSAMKSTYDNLDRVQRVMTMLPIAARATVMGLVGLVALKMVFDQTSAAIRAAQERLEALLKIANDARSAGVGTSFLQAWTGQARDLGVEAGRLASMLDRAREASTVRVGEGENAASSTMVDRLRQNVQAGNLGQADLDRFTVAESQEQRIRVILDLIDQLRAKGAQLAAFDLGGKMFGAEFENQLRSGVDLVAKMRTSLDGLKSSGGERIVTPEEIANAESVNVQLDRARDLMANALRPIQEDIARWQQQQLRDYADLVETTSRWAAALLGVYKILQDVGNYIEKLGNASVWDKIYDAAKAAGMAGNWGGTGTFEEAPPGGFKPLEVKVGPSGIAPKNDTSKALPSLKTSGGSSTSEDRGEIERFLASLTKAVDLAEAELAAIGKSNKEREVALALVKAKAAAQQEGRELTGEELARVRSMAEALAAAKDKSADLNQALRQNAEFARTFGDAATDALTDIIFEGKSAADVLQNLGKQFAKYALQAALTGQGPLAGLLGTAPSASAGANATGGLFSFLTRLIGSGVGASAGIPTMAQGGFGPDIPAGFRANGGPVRAGRPYRVGELGAEIIVPGQDGKAYPVARGGGFGPGAGGFNVTINNAAGVSATAEPDGQGGITIETMLDGIENRMADRAARGRGSLAKASQARAGGGGLRG